ncbi:MAG: hypothetical protein AB1483_04595 [Candidatus Zixiibacteriota bacterium]
MRSIVTFIASILIAVTLAGPAQAAGNCSQPCVTYISAEGVYLDGGLSSGFDVDDTVAFIRDKKTIAIGFVTKVAEYAAATEVAHQTCPVQVGDIAARISDVPRLTLTSTAAFVEPARAPHPEATSTINQKPGPPPHLRGSISFENYYHNDLTDTDYDRTQPGVKTKLEIENITGDVSFKMRHRTRLYHRSKAYSIGQDTDEWIHQVYELGFFHEVEGSKAEWAIGRVLSPYVRGIGYVDGGYLAHQIHRNFKIGLAGGTAPDMVSSEPNFDRRKFGLFAAFETGAYQTRRLAFTAAVSTEYDRSTVSRDFLYFQATFSKYQLLSLYQSVEIDFNRDWRYDKTGDRFTFTNYYANATINITKDASVFFSYDARKNIRYFETMDTPDSLFNDDYHQGIRAGLNLRFTDRISFRGNAGIRFRDGLPEDNRFVSATLRLSRFPLPKHSMTLMMSIVETQFTTGYRPMITYRLPISRRLAFNITGSSYIYKTGSKTTSYYYADASTYYSFARRYYLAGTFRQYFDSRLKSVELRTELGIRL